MYFKKVKKILIPIIISIIAMFALPTYSHAKEFSQADVGQVVADFALYLYENHKGDFTYTSKKDYNSRAFVGVKSSGNQYGTSGNNRTGTFSNKYAMNCHAFTKFVVGYALGIHPDDVKNGKDYYVSIGKKNNSEIRPGDILEFVGHYAICAAKSRK